jgi:polysaccharide pyruvyl transferase WcaK-like protein
MRLCLTGGWFSSDNVGDHAILTGLSDAMGRHPDAELSVITAGPDKVRERFGLDAYAPKRTPLGLLRNLMRSDALVYTGGTPLYDAAPHMTYYASLAVLAHARGIPVAVFGISLRSLDSGICRWMARRIARRASILGGREARTVERLEALAPGTGTACLVPDAAFGMTPSPPSTARTLLADAGVDPDARRVAICMRDFRSERKFQAHHYSSAFDGPARERYADVMRRIAEHLVRRHDADVVFCPMHTVAPDDDRRIMREVREAIADESVRNRCTLLESQLGPREMQAILGSMYATIGVRFHSTVLSAAMGVPCLAVGYAPKNRAIMEQLGLGEYVFDLSDLRFEPVVERLDDLLANRSGIADTLRTECGELRHRFHAACDRLAALASDHSRRSRKRA